MFPPGNCNTNTLELGAFNSGLINQVGNSIGELRPKKSLGPWPWVIWALTLSVCATKEPSSSMGCSRPGCNHATLKQLKLGCQTDFTAHQTVTVGSAHIELMVRPSKFWSAVRLGGRCWPWSWWPWGNLWCNCWPLIPMSKSLQSLGANGRTSHTLPRILGQLFEKDMFQTPNRGVFNQHLLCGWLLWQRPECDGWCPAGRGHQPSTSCCLFDLLLSWETAPAVDGTRPLAKFCKYVVIQIAVELVLCHQVTTWSCCPWAVALCGNSNAIKFRLFGACEPRFVSLPSFSVPNAVGVRPLKMGVYGMWWSMVLGTGMATVCLAMLLSRVNWAPWRICAFQMLQFADFARA